MDAIVSALSSGLPLLVLHLGVAIVLLFLAIGAHQLLTPFKELELARQGNLAAATVLAGTSIALALPVAASLATSAVLIDIVIWSTVGLVLQLALYAGATRVLGDFRGRIERGEVAAALVLVGWQWALALLNAAALSL
ncbi:MAG: DUF350 domain-containing protein [Alphaproteobacteria bacterium]|nr:MAG: DUF350 domain-containing protein [Alphaproteobacteria bacterium]